MVQSEERVKREKSRSRMGKTIFRRQFPVFFSFIKKIFSFLKKDRTENVLIDSSGMLNSMHFSKEHLLYALLFALGTASALWQHGEPIFTFAVLAGIIPLAFFILLPYRLADIFVRQLVSCFLFFCSCFWIIFRLKRSIPFDLALIEGLIIGSSAFFVNSTLKNYNYLCLISLFLLIYGGLIPRKLLLILAPLTLLCVVLLQSAERQIHLAGTEKLYYPAEYSFWRSLFRSWHFPLIHLLFALPVFLLVFCMMPLKDSGSEGLFEVSFMTGRKSSMPPDLKKWLRQDNIAVKDPQGEYQHSTGKPDTLSSSGKKMDIPDSPAMSEGRGSGSPPGKDLLFTVSMPLKLYHLAALYDEYDGRDWRTSQALQKSKSHSFSRTKYVKKFEVVSRYNIVKWWSPKLYAPFRPLYYRSLQTDPELINIRRYRLKRSFFGASFNGPAGCPPLPYRYAVTSAVNAPLVQKKETKPSADRAYPEISSTAGSFFSHQTVLERERQLKEAQAREKRLKAQQAARERRLKAQRAAREKRLKAQRAARRLQQKKKGAATKKTSVKKGGTKNRQIKKPVQKKKLVLNKKFTVRRAKNAKKARIRRTRRVIKRDPAWQSSLPKSHYCKLPENISPRVIKLAENITKNCLTPYEKAIALRDYLRSNYQYRLYAERTPQNCESVEHFLFTLKEGHCEYFAAALTVLARTQKLPARIATGFSPGNFNTLTGEFEVYEYHAHAWSQIFIDNVGWLTFDAVPPGEIVSETTPAGIGRLRDPFGEQWRVTPPELTDKSLEYFKRDQQRKEEQKKADQLQWEKYRELEKEKKQPEEKQVKIKEAGSGKNLKGSASPGVLQRLKSLFRDLKSQKNAVSGSSSGNRLALVFAAVLIAAAGFSGRRILKEIKRFLIHRRLKKVLGLAEAERTGNPEKSILHLYRAARLLLILAGIKRHNQELMLYADRVEDLFLAEWKKRRHSRVRKSRGRAVEPVSWSSITGKGREMSAALKQIFSAFYAVEYGHCSVTGKDCDLQFAAFRRIRVILQELYPDMKGS